MKIYHITFRPYPAGAGTRARDEQWQLEGNSLREILDRFYTREYFNPYWRVVDVELVHEDKPKRKARRA
jgi:hypothetical protein